MIWPLPTFLISFLQVLWGPLTLKSGHFSTMLCLLWILVLIKVPFSGMLFLSKDTLDYLLLPEEASFL